MPKFHKQVEVVIAVRLRRDVDVNYLSGVLSDSALSSHPAVEQLASEQSAGEFVAAAPWSVVSSEVTQRSFSPHHIAPSDAVECDIVVQ